MGDHFETLGAAGMVQISMLLIGEWTKWHLAPTGARMVCWCLSQVERLEAVHSEPVGGYKFKYSIGLCVGKWTPKFKMLRCSKRKCPINHF